MKNSVFAMVFGALLMVGCGGLDEGEETTEQASQAIYNAAPKPTKVDALTRCVLRCLGISTDCKANQNNPSSSYFNNTDAECEAQADWCMKNHCTSLTKKETVVAQ